MAFPIVTPAFFKELVDVSKPVEEYSSFTDIIVSPAAVEYILHLSNPDVVRKLMSIENGIEFKMSQIEDGKDAQFIAMSQSAIESNYTATYYWQLRTLMMNILQNKNVTLEKRILLLNYGLKTVQGMFDNNQPNEIPRFVSIFTNEQQDYSEVLKYFNGISPNFAYSLTDGISFLKSLSKSSPAYKEVMRKVYTSLGVSGPETLNQADIKKYIEMRRVFTTEFMEAHSHWIENIMVNYVWCYSLPFALSGRMTVWENYLFFCTIYNAIKVLVSCYMPGRSEDDFVKAISAFDDALRKSGFDTVWKVVNAIKNAGQANNGDMAILVVS